jgi:hypothetical protein
MFFSKVLWFLKFGDFSPQKKKKKLSEFTIKEQIFSKVSKIFCQQVPNKL